MITLVVVHVALWQLRALGAHPWWTVGLLTIAFAAFGIAVVHLESKLTLGTMLIVAALLRVLLLPLPPTLSDDTLRYVWDGRVTSAGFNPYLLAPEDATLTELRDARWQVMPHKEVPTVYPPLALGLFAAGTLLPDPVLGIKILLVFIDLLACYLLFILAGHLGAPPGRAAWYAWNPLVVLEVAGQGHVDALMVACMVATVLYLARQQPIKAGLAAAAGVASKLVPLVLILIWARTLLTSNASDGTTAGIDARRASIFVVTATLTLLVVFAPVAVTTGVPPGLVTYGVSWEFNGPLYEPLWRAIDYLDPIDEIKSLIDHVKGYIGELTGHDFWNRLYPFVYPQFLAKLLLMAGFAISWLVLLVRSRRPMIATGRVLGAVILCMATLYPWYLLWILPWAALSRHRAWLALAPLMILAYLPQHDPGVALFPWIWGCIWIPFFILLWRSPPWSTEVAPCSTD